MTEQELSHRDLVDEREIIATCIRYASAIDARDWKLLRTCFRDDVVAEYAGLGEFAGYQANEDMIRKTLTPLTRTQHLLGNHTVELRGDEAMATCYLQAQHVRTGTEGGDQFIMAGRYVDDLARTPDGWRIVRRSLEIWWTAGNPAVVGG